MLLYDLSKDIHVDKNVADQHPKIVRKLEKMILKAHTTTSAFNFER